MKDFSSVLLKLIAASAIFAFSCTLPYTDEGALKNNDGSTVPGDKDEEEDKLPEYEGVSAPSDLTATQGTSLVAVTLNWSDSDNASFYRIYRSSDEFSGFSILEDNYEESSYEDEVGAALQNQFFFYKIKAVDENGLESGYSNCAKGYATSFNPPTQIIVSNMEYNDKIVLNWEDVVGAVSYEVYGSDIKDDLDNPDDAKKLCTTEDSYYEHSGLAKDQDFYYCIKAYSSDNASKASSIVSGATLSANAPASVTDFTYKTFSSKIEFSWNQPEQYLGWEMFRKNSDGFYVFWANGSAIESTFREAADNTPFVQDGKDLFYEVRCFKIQGETKIYSPFVELNNGNSVSIDISAPWNVAAAGSVDWEETATGIPQIVLTWQVEANTKSYVIRKTCEGESDDIVLDYEGGAGEYCDYEIETGKVYSYSLKRVASASTDDNPKESEFCEVVEAFVTDKPNNFAAVEVTPDQRQYDDGLPLSWTSLDSSFYGESNYAGSVKYFIYRKEVGAEEEFTLLTSLQGLSQNEYIDESAYFDKVYIYMIKASSENGGESIFSSAVPAKRPVTNAGFYFKFANIYLNITSDLKSCDSNSDVTLSTSYPVNPEEGDTVISGSAEFECNYQWVIPAGQYDKHFRFSNYFRDSLYFNGEFYRGKGYSHHRGVYNGTVKLISPDDLNETFDGSITFNNLDIDYVPKAGSVTIKQTYNGTEYTSEFNWDDSAVKDLPLFQ